MQKLPLILVALWLILLPACSQKQPQPMTEAQQKSLSLLLPTKIEIVEPFTRARALGTDNKSADIELLLRAVNALDNPGLMIVGHVQIELFSYVPASADHKGTRIEDWKIDLTDEKNQVAYWNRLTQTYEFHLAVDQQRVTPANKYVLQVTYEDPMGKRLFDEFVISPERSADAGRVRSVTG